MLPSRVSPEGSTIRLTCLLEAQTDELYPRATDGDVGTEAGRLRFQSAPQGTLGDTRASKTFRTWKKGKMVYLHVSSQSGVSSPVMRQWLNHSWNLPPSGLNADRFLKFPLNRCCFQQRLGCRASGRGRELRPSCWNALYNFKPRQLPV